MALETRIKEYREKAGYKQNELAEMVGARRETIVHLENGRYNPSLKLAMDIAKVFGVAVEDLFVFTEEQIINYKKYYARKNSVVANFATTASDGKVYQVDYYNLDVIIIDTDALIELQENLDFISSKIAPQYSFFIYERLKEENINAQLHEIKNACHGFETVVGSSITKECMDRRINWFQQFI